jgi:hypothetical protein
MMIRTDELSGAALDWAVGRCEIPAICGPLIRDGEVYYSDMTPDYFVRYQPSLSWLQCGPLIEKYRFEIIWTDTGRNEGWSAVREWNWGEVYKRHPLGETHLIAACRAIVTIHLGHSVDVPDSINAHTTPHA